MQRVLRKVYGRTKGVSETQSLAEFIFKDRPEAPEQEHSENLHEASKHFKNGKWDRNSKSQGTRKLRLVELMRESINGFLATEVGAAYSYKDFSEAPVAIVREGRQLPDANNLQKRFTYKLSH